MDEMSDTVWKVMVDVQIARRDRERPSAAPKTPRRTRPSTLRSIRELLLDDHYAILAAGKY
jgi:hypothetical protein